MGKFIAELLKRFIVVALTIAMIGMFYNGLYTIVFEAAYWIGIPVKTTAISGAVLLLIIVLGSVLFDAFKNKKGEDDNGEK